MKRKLVLLLVRCSLVTVCRIEAFKISRKLIHLDLLLTTIEIRD